MISFIISTIMISVSLSLMLLRNNFVSEYRNSLLDQIYQATQEDIRQKRDWKWRFIVYREISYSKMLTKFWKPLDSFYVDKSFLDPYATNPLKCSKMRQRTNAN